MGRGIERAANITQGMVGVSSMAAMLAAIVAGDVQCAAVSGAVLGANVGVCATRFDFKDEREQEQEQVKNR